VISRGSALVAMLARVLLGAGVIVVTQLSASSAGGAAPSGFRGGLSSDSAASVRHVRAGNAGWPLVFVPNAGQVAARVQYLAQGGGVGFAFTRRELMLSLGEGRRGYALALRFLGSNPEVRLVGGRRGPGRVNYLFGRDPAGWRTDFPTYGELVYRELWPGIDLVFRGAAGRLKYEFRLRPGADPERIRLAYAGASRVSLTRTGALAVKTPAGVLTDSRPVSHQPIGGRRVAVSSRYRLLGAKEHGFELGDYDRGYPLVVDPGLAYSTFLGGSGPDSGRALALDRTGHAYVTGAAQSVDFPTTPGSFDRDLGGIGDIFVTKLNAAGSGLVYSTFIGGGDLDVGYGIALDRAGNAYVTGDTYSADFPTTPGAFDRSFNGDHDAFVLKLNPTGSALVYSTYLGRNGPEAGKAIAVDRQGRAYATGTTGAGFPTTPGAFDPVCGPSQDAFVSKLNRAGRKLVYSTCLGGSKGELGNAIALDRSGSAYATGTTSSADFPTTAGAFDREHSGGLDDVYVAKVNPAGSKLTYSSFLGAGESSSEGQDGWGIAVDRAGSAYVTGDTNSDDFPTTAGAFDTSFNGFIDAFVTRLNPNGSGLVYSTYLGGTGHEVGNAIALDQDGDAYLTGITGSAGFPTTPDAFDRSWDGWDAFVTRLSADGSTLAYSTFLGGHSVGGEEGTGIAADQAGNAYLAGGTASADFPTTPDAFDRSCGGCQDQLGDAFVTKLPTRGLVRRAQLPGVPGHPAALAACPTGALRLRRILLQGRSDPARSSCSDPASGR
jgi:hypothetical protein